MKKTITNKKGQKIVLLLDIPKKSKGVVFIAHGLGGFKEQVHIKTMAKTFLRNSYIVIRWDARNTAGDSEGNLLDATLSNYYQDLKTVIKWASKQKWYQEPFILAGHSLGSACCILYTLEYPKKVKALAPLSTFFSGKEFEKRLTAKEFESWKKTGVKEWESSSRPGLLKRLKWSFMEDAYSYDLLAKSNQIIVPILLVVGNKDLVTPLSMHKKLFSSISSKNKILHIIKDAEHTFNNEVHLKQIENYIKEWLERIYI